MLSTTVAMRAIGPAASMSPKPMVDTASKLNHMPSPKVRHPGSASHTMSEQKRKSTPNIAVMCANLVCRKMLPSMRALRRIGCFGLPAGMRLGMFPVSLSGMHAGMWSGLHLGLRPGMQLGSPPGVRLDRRPGSFSDMQSSSRSVMRSADGVFLA